MLMSAARTCRMVIGLVLLSLCQGCVSDSRQGLPPSSPFVEPASANALLPQGVAAGDVTDRSALVWLRTDGPARVQVVWAPDRQPEALVKSAVFTTSDERDFTLMVPLEGLAPAAAYRYRVLVAGIEDRPFQEAAREAGQGRFSTAAAQDVAAPVTFAWSGDLGGQQRCRG
ncbi:MAG: PhoD-like phosphatase N-terminal domain-containing protein, partial [Nitrospiraceae bacterium]